MATIGTFTKTEDGYAGRLQTLTLDIQVTLHSSTKEHEKSPDFKIRSANGDFGAAWKRTSAAEREYLSCKLDDPTFPAPIYASLVLGDDGENFSMIWSR